jgi:hypothetical protein
MLSGLPWGQAGHAVTSSLLLFLMNPLLYIGLGLIIWDLSKIGKFERKLFGVRVSAARGLVISLLLQSLLIGLCMSVAGVLAGVFVTITEVWLVTGMAILLGILRMRLLSPTYSIAAFILFSTLTRVVTPPNWGPWFHHWWLVLSGFHSVSWLALLAMMTLAEGVALWWNMDKPAFPAAVLSKRGRTIGGFAVRLVWMAPVLVAAPGQDVGLSAFGHTWPWLVGAQSSVSIVALPVLMGYSGLLTTVTPRAAVRRLAINHVYSGLVVAVSVYVAYQFGMVYALSGAVVALILKESGLWKRRQSENRLDPLFTPTTLGVRVLTTIQGSLSQSLGLQPGEVITHVNQVPVHTPYDLHFAFDQNPAYAKLQVQDIRGETRFVGNPVYSGERNKLGLVLAPDSYGPCFQYLQPGLLQTTYLRFAAHGRNPELDWVESTSVPPANS